MNENGPSNKKYSDDVKSDPYLGKMNHAWFSNNSVGRIVIKDIVLIEV
ncbi:MAG: hypothetical protein ACPKQO_10055 [Nitrososphaeraceae archaeon]